MLDAKKSAELQSCLEVHSGGQQGAGGSSLTVNMRPKNSRSKLRSSNLIKKEFSESLNSTMDENKHYHQSCSTVR